MSITPINKAKLSVATDHAPTLEAIREVETQVAETIALIVGAKLTFAHMTTLKYADKELIKCIAEHAVVTNTLKHKLNKAKARRIDQIRKGVLR
jgi:hypothetical protein